MSTPKTRDGWRAVLLDLVEVLTRHEVELCVSDTGQPVLYDEAGVELEMEFFRPDEGTLEGHFYRPRVEPRPEPISVSNDEVDFITIAAEQWERITHENMIAKQTIEQLERRIQDLEDEATNWAEAEQR